MSDRIKDAFRGVHAEEDIKRNTLDFIEQKRNKRFSASKLVPAFAAICLVVLAYSGLFAYFTPISEISMDINPSIELEINRFDRVLSVKAYNEDGEELASQLSVKNRNYVDAVEEIADSAAIKAYLDKGELLTITVVGNNEEKSSQMLQKVTSSEAAEQKNVACEQSNHAEAEAAHEAGLSCGKYRAYLELHALDPEVSTEDVQGLSMRQIHDMIDACEDGAEEHGTSGHDAEDYGTSAYEAETRDCSETNNSTERGYSSSGNGHDGGHDGGYGRHHE